MLKIGDFSKLSRVSIRMLRHYDEIELLRPVKIDEVTGYRYYGEDQLLQAGRIHVLRNMGFGLAVIKEIMDRYTDAAQLEQFLLIRVQELKEQQAIINERLTLLDSTIRWLRKDGTIMGYDVQLKTLPERYVASVRQVIPAYEMEGKLWQIFTEETADMNLQESNPGCDTAVFFDGEFREQDVDVEIQRTVTGTYQDTRHVRFKTVPPVQIASAMLNGNYTQIAQVNEAVATWIRDNGYEFDGFGFNIYHVSPCNTQNPDEYVTEVCYPVRKK